MARRVAVPFKGKDMPKPSVVVFAAVIATFATAAIAGDLTAADYQFLNTKMNTTKEQVEKNIDPKFWAMLHQLINSSATLDDKKKFYATLVARSTCEYLKKDGVLPPDMEC